MLTYKGYHAKVDLDYDTGALYGRVVNTRDIIFFEATSFEQLKKEFEFSIDDYLTMCAERGEEPDRPYSGKVALRISPELHRAVTTAAKVEGKSLNAWLTDTIEGRVRRELPQEAVLD